MSEVMTELFRPQPGDEMSPELKEIVAEQLSDAARYVRTIAAEVHMNHLELILQLRKDTALIAQARAAYSREIETVMRAIASATRENAQAWQAVAHSHTAVREAHRVLFEAALPLMKGLKPSTNISERG